ncbi:carnitine O-palmitoyltransferase 2, mitochondrial-like [Ptychodera flava]|uniref:carnitine O-palmitoyltransferase 2, mitochondrial-like n=1 Tax=Ptychodera flava TaxID=63121 RepID=UPI00396AAED2
MACLQRFLSGKPILCTAPNLKTLGACQSYLRGSNQHGKQYSSSAPSDDFLPASVVPTMHFQPSLPRLPIPKLEDTCDRYLKSQRPVLDDENFSKTSKLVSDFLEGEGKELNEALIAKDKKNKHTSYITGPWFDMYLEARVPVVLNHNPFITFNMDPRPEYNDQVIRSTNFIVSAMRFMKTIRAGILEPEVFHLNPSKSDTQSFRNVVRWVPSSLSWYAAYLYKAFPLDMSQYKNLFNSTRIPKQHKDELFSDTSARHIVVMRNGHFYVFDVIASDGSIIPATEIQAHLEHIISDKTPAPEHGVGILTTENRDTWASLRSQLEEAGNADTLRLVDSAVFCLCLEDAAPGIDPESLTRLKLYGDGVNRWYDKSFQLIVCKDGTSSINMEHAWGDGVAVVRFMDDAFKDNIDRPALAPGTPPAKVDSAQSVRKLEWNLTPAIKEGIDNATKSFHQCTSSLGMHTLENKKLTKSVFKECKVSPDSMMQLSFQMAYYRLTGRTTATYESCSTAAFKHGRTETLRSATIETKQCSEAFSQSGISNDEKRQLLMACSDKHNQLTKEAAMGQGWDRHMFALRHLAQDSGRSLTIFEDPAYKAINHIILSTSTLARPSILFGGFAPVVPNGLGIGYQIGDERCGCNVTSYPTSPDAAGFVECVGTSLNDIYHVLSNTK